jgi:uncharacterized membrane protein
MHTSPLHYLPLSWPFFAILVAIFVMAVVWVEIRALHYAFTRLGISSRVAILLLFGSLLGSYVNIPVAELPDENIVASQEVDYFGMQYEVPVSVEWPGTIIAVNVGGAVIPIILSLYLLSKHDLWIRGFIATASMTVICHALAHPVRGVGIAIPVFVPLIATAAVSLLISRRYAAPLAYVSGSLGVLIGADLLNLDKIRGLGAPVASIGGAGTFDGIFITGILAVLLASFASPRGGGAVRTGRA